MRWAVIGPYDDDVLGQPPEPGRLWVEIDAPTAKRAVAAAYRRRDAQNAVSLVALPGEIPYKYLRAVPIPEHDDCPEDMTCSRCVAFEERVCAAEARIDQISAHAAHPYPVPQEKVG